MSQWLFVQIRYFTPMLGDY